MPTTQLARCVVHIDGLETTYLRAGRGSSVVLLVERPNAIDEIDGLVVVLSPHHRLTIPSLGTENRTQCLRTFLDGIGLLNANLLAMDGWALPALTFALSEPDRVDRLAVLQSGQGEPETVVGRIDGVGATGHPLFVALGGAYNDERSGFHISTSMADALIYFFSGVMRGTA